MNISEKIKWIRDTKSISQLYMAEELGITQSEYSKLEGGKRKLSTDRIEQIAKVLKVNSDDIINLNEKIVFNLFKNKNANGLVINQVSAKEHLIYESHINSLKEEINHLKDVISKLLKNNGNKKSTKSK